MTARLLRLAVVVRPDAETCRVATADGPADVRYSVPFAPRAAGLTPGQLVAVTPTAAGSDVVLWRWFDAVVLDVPGGGGLVPLWEPAHGEVLARPRRPEQQPYRTGGRAWLSAGLPGADWWVCGPTTSEDVDVDEVSAFYTTHGLWDRLV
ncbi:MAG: hypothetical protein JWN08_763 [Frankiales bacterium]|nr:hypothetical protein [Frankiales bacterium]